MLSTEALPNKKHLLKRYSLSLPGPYLPGLHRPRTCRKPGGRGQGEGAGGGPGRGCLSHMDPGSDQGWFIPGPLPNQRWVFFFQVTLGILTMTEGPKGRPADIGITQNLPGLFGYVPPSLNLPDGFM